MLTPCVGSPSRGIQEWFGWGLEVDCLPRAGVALFIYILVSAIIHAYEWTKQRRKNVIAISCHAFKLCCLWFTPEQEASDQTPG